MGGSSDGGGGGGGRRGEVDILELGDSYGGEMSEGYGGGWEDDDDVVGGGDDDANDTEQVVVSLPLRERFGYKRRAVVDVRLCRKDTCQAQNGRSCFVWF